MSVYSALLRGINVGGSKVILMDDLKKTLEKSGLSNVRTYIQSGNVVFASEEKNTADLEGTIRTSIKDRFKFDVSILVLGLDELEKIIKKNPFGENNIKKSVRIHLTLLLQKPSKERVAELAGLKKNFLKTSRDGDDFEMIDRTIYVLCRNGWAQSPFNSSVTEKILKVDTTSRNLDTMNKLVEIGKSIAA